MMKTKRNPRGHPRAHPELDFLIHCDTCKTFRDETLYEFPLDMECNLCKRKRERIRLGLFDPNNCASSGMKSWHRQRRACTAEFEKAMSSWKLQRRRQLKEAGVPEWNHYAIIKAEYPEHKARWLSGKA